MTIREGDVQMNVLELALAHFHQAVWGLGVQTDTNHRSPHLFI